jgi:hypothetical protein
MNNLTWTRAGEEEPDVYEKVVRLWALSREGTEYKSKHISYYMGLFESYDLVG